MLVKLERVWPFISMGLLLALLAVSIFRPAVVGIASWTMIGLSLAAVLAFTIRKPVEAHRQGRIDGGLMRRLLLVDLSGLLISMLAVSLTAGIVTRMVASAAGEAWGVTAGLLAALAAGLVVGVVIGLQMRRLWQKLTRSFLFKASQKPPEHS